MKHFMLLVIAFVAVTGLTAQPQQAPIYLLFNSGCMNQLEYRYAYSGATVMAYTISPNANQNYILYAGISGTNAAALPPGTLNCQDLRIDQSFLDAINKLQRQVYMVHQTQQGYLLMPLITAMQVERTGSYYFFRHPNYQFALDTANLVYQANLASAGSPNYVYFNGLHIRDCVYQYSFRSEPTQMNREMSDFEFIPEIGIISSNSGVTASEMETNTLRLWYVNGMNLEDYIKGNCNPNAIKNTGKVPVYDASAKIPADKYNNPTPSGQLPAAANPSPAGAANCAEKSGDGYHIVQTGETLLSISRKYKVPLKTLVSWNKISNPDKIEPCQKLYVKKPAATTAAPALAIKQPAAAAPPIAEPTQKMVPVHIVQQGETVSGIARMYGLTEARFRQINNLPETGAIVIRPGQQFMVSEVGQPVIYQTPPVNTQPAVNQPPAAQPVANPNRPLDFNAISPANPQPSVQPVTTLPFNNQVTEAVPSKVDQAAKKATYYQEYIVQQGDTMNSIAIKFGTSAQELALLNNKETSETLIAGQRLLIPK